MPGGVDEGLYESLHTAALERRLHGLPDGAAIFAALDKAAAPDVLARHVAEIVRRSLLSNDDGQRRQDLVNKLVDLLEAHDDDAVIKLEQLLAVSVAPGAHPVARPAMPLSDTALLTNTKDEPSLGAELRAEIASADRVDLLCAFVKWHGMRLLTDQLDDLKSRGKPLRVITTTYLGGTAEHRAVDELIRRYGASVKNRYESDATRLSISSVATPALVRKFEATFDTYWNSPDFRAYDPDRDADLLDRALGAQAGGGANILELSGLEVLPRPHQEHILGALEAERFRGHHRNLVVAATGTGKTVVAALDYRRLGGAEKSLLFVAHRKELLDQARRTYREVLGNGTFGELLVAGQRPTQWKHVFASVQSLRDVDLRQYDVAVIDEFHHAEAPSYKKLLDRLQCTELLGLTATPDRADGVDVRDFFGGRVAVEIGLSEALEQDLLCPFHYFGIADNTDLRSIEWKRGSYDTDALDRVYTGNDARTRSVLNALRDRVTDVGRMRALGFCVSVAHARYVAEAFTTAGVPARAVTGETAAHDRASATDDLRDNKVAVLFTVDLYNEGVDLPFVDTVLFLRPTQSATIFLQQFGRGLRRAQAKAVLTVLDFIGQHRREFRLDVRHRAQTGSTRVGLEQGSPYLPPKGRLFPTMSRRRWFSPPCTRVYRGWAATASAGSAEVAPRLTPEGGRVPLRKVISEDGQRTPSGGSDVNDENSILDHTIGQSQERASRARRAREAKFPRGPRHFRPGSYGASTELVALPNYPTRDGVAVALRDQPASQHWRVLRLAKASRNFAVPDGDRRPYALPRPACSATCAGSEINLGHIRFGSSRWRAGEGLDQPLRPYDQGGSQRYYRALRSVLSQHQRLCESVARTSDLGPGDGNLCR